MHSFWKECITLVLETNVMPPKKILDKFYYSCKIPKGQLWWHKCIILAIGKRRPEDQNWVSLENTVSSRQAWVPGRQVSKPGNFGHYSLVKYFHNILMALSSFHISFSAEVGRWGWGWSRWIQQCKQRSITRLYNMNHHCIVGEKYYVHYRGLEWWKLVMIPISATI